MAKIVFQSSTGEQYMATLTGNTLSDVRPLGKTPSSPMPLGVSRPAEEADQEETEESELESKSGGTTHQPNRIFVEQLKAVLVNNRARKQLRNKQKGILDTRKLVQTQLDNTSVWRQNNRKDSQRNYSICFLVDESGSMHGPKAELAQDVIQEMVASLGEVDGVETAVLGFSGNRIVEHKRFDNKGMTSLDAIDIVSRSDTAVKLNRLCPSDHENADLIAIEYGLGYLRKTARPNSRMVFVLLSDGMPCPSSHSIDVLTAGLTVERFRSKIVPKVEDTRGLTPMHALVHKNPDILSFGLGMLEGGQQIPKHKVVKDINHTRRALIAFLRGTLQ